MRSTSIFQCQLPIGGWNLEFGSYKGPIPWGQPPTSNWGLEVGGWKLKMGLCTMRSISIFQCQIPTSNWRLEFGGWKLKRNIVLPWCQLPTSNWRLDMKKEYRFPEINLQLRVSTSNWRLEVGSWKGTSVTWYQLPICNRLLKMKINKRAQSLIKTHYSNLPRPWKK